MNIYFGFYPSPLSGNGDRVTERVKGSENFYVLEFETLDVY